MSGEPLERIDSRTESKVAFLSIDIDTFRDPSGLTYERVAVRHPGAVGVVPVRGDEIILVKQYRTPVGRAMIEIPAGKLDGEDDLMATAQRECEEETGYRPGRLEHLRTIHTTPGFSDERIDLFVATELEYVGASPDGVEEEAAEVLHLDRSVVARMMANGEISDAKTLIALADVLGG